MSSSDRVDKGKCSEACCLLQCELPQEGKRMKGKVVVITGATSGIGEIAAPRLARMGTRIALVARGAERTRHAGRGWPVGSDHSISTVRRRYPSDET